MSQWLDIAPVENFPTGDIKRIELEGDAGIAVFNIEGEYFAVEDRCRHENVPIIELMDIGFSKEEILEGYEMICPRHGGRVCVKTGQALAPPIFEDVATFAVRVEHGIVQVSDTPKE